MSEAAKKPFDPNEFIVETDRMMKEAKKKKEFDPDEFIRETDALLQPQGTNKTGGFAVGLAEAYNPLSLIRPAETFGREILNTKTEMVPDPHGGITFRPVNAEEARAKAEKDTVTPDLSVRNILSKIGAKDFVSNLNPSAEKAGMLTGTALSLGEGGLKLIGKPGMFSKLTKEGQLLSKEAQAAKAEDKFMQTTSEILGENDPTKIKDIQQNVGRIEELVNKGRNNEAGLDVTDKIRTELKNIETSLGNNVRKYRDEISKNNKDIIKTPSAIQILDEMNPPVSRSKPATLDYSGSAKQTSADLYLQTPPSKESDLFRVKLDGQTNPPTGEDKFLNDLKLKIQREKNPSNILDLVDKIDSEAKTFYNIRSAGGKTSLSKEDLKYYDGLLKVRNELKVPLHNLYPGYANVDKPFSEFQDLVWNIERKINGINGESYVKNIFNAGKTEARNDLESALSLAGGTSAPETFKEIRSINVANDIIGKGDVRLDQANRVFLKYKDQYLNRASNVGKIGGMVSGLTIGGNLSGGYGAVAGGGMGQYILGETFKSLLTPRAIKYGQKMASPDRIFETAKTANKLSAEAKQLAADIQTASKVQGGIDKLLPYISALPAFKEFLTFAQSQQESTK